MSDLYKQTLALAESQKEAGASVEQIVAALCKAMIAIVPDDDTLKKEAILEGAYAHLAKLLGRDASAKDRSYRRREPR